MKILIVNGPNLNLLGRREPDIYGTVTFEDFFSTLQESFGTVELEYFQSNHEGLMPGLSRTPPSPWPMPWLPSHPPWWRCTSATFTRGSLSDATRLLQPAASVVLLGWDWRATGWPYIFWWKRHAFDQDAGNADQHSHPPPNWAPRLLGGRKSSIRTRGKWLVLVVYCRITPVVFVGNDVGSRLGLASQTGITPDGHCHW